jgi:hypothetical protein
LVVYLLHSRVEGRFPYFQMLLAQHSATSGDKDEAVAQFVAAYDQTGTGYANGVGRLTSTSHPSGSTQYTLQE